MRQILSKFHTHPFWIAAQASVAMGLSLAFLLSYYTNLLPYSLNLVRIIAVVFIVLGVLQFFKPKEGLDWMDYAVGDTKIIFGVWWLNGLSVDWAITSIMVLWFFEGIFFLLKTLAVVKTKRNY